MRTLKLGFLTAAVIGLTACPADRDVPPPALEEPIAPPTEAPVMAPVAATTANLQPMAGATTTGTVRATPRNGRTEVNVMLQNAPPNESVGARIMSGTCESPGVEVARLDAISTDGMGTGQSNTDVGHAPQLILDGNHIAAIYAPGTEPERDMPIACATLGGNM
jgi:hypothetical protein